MVGFNRSHYSGDYAARAKVVRQRARLVPTLCARCGKLIEAHQPVDAGHVNDGQPNGPLRAEHATCNRSAGAILGNRRRIGLRTSRQW